MTDEALERVTDAIRRGASIGIAASYAGIARSTLSDWLSTGRAALMKHGVGQIPEELAEVAAFTFAVEQAMGEFKLDALARIAADPAWQSDAWILERQWPDEFGRRQRIDHGNAEGEPFRVQPTPMFDPSKLTDEELDDWIRLARKAAPDTHPVIEHHPPRALPE